MSELGQMLAEARAAQEMSLADVEEATRIRQKYLEAFEQGDYAKLPLGAIARGFLRVYADFLGLDSEEAVYRYNEESGDKSIETPIAEVGKPRLVDYRPIEVELMDTRPNLGWVRWAAALVIVGALAVAGRWFLGRGVGANLPAALGPAPTSTSIPSATPTRWIVTATSTVTGSTAGATPTSDLLTLPTPTVPPTITPTPRPTATAEVVAHIALTVRIDQRAWVRAIADNAVVLETTVEPGQTITWEANNTLKVLTGNAGGVDLTLNGANLGKMGGVGQVIERTWVVDQGQVTEQAPGTGSPTPTRTATPSG